MFEPGSTSFKCKRSRRQTARARSVSHRNGCPRLHSDASLFGPQTAQNTLDFQGRSCHAVRRVYDGPHWAGRPQRPAFLQVAGPRRASRVLLPSCLGLWVLSSAPARRSGFDGSGFGSRLLRLERTAHHAHTPFRRRCRRAGRSCGLGLGTGPPRVQLPQRARAARVAPALPGGSRRLGAPPRVQRSFVDLAPDHRRDDRGLPARLGRPGPGGVRRGRVRQLVGPRGRRHEPDLVLAVGIRARPRQPFDEPGAHEVVERARVHGRRAHVRQRPVHALLHAQRRARRGRRGRGSGHAVAERRAAARHMPLDHAFPRSWVWSPPERRGCETRDQDQHARTAGAARPRRSSRHTPRSRSRPPTSIPPQSSSRARPTAPQSPRSRWRPTLPNRSPRLPSPRRWCRTQR